MHCTCLCIASESRCGATACTHSTHPVFTYCSVPAVERPVGYRLDRQDSWLRAAGHPGMDKVLCRQLASLGSRGARVYCISCACCSRYTVTLLLLLRSGSVVVSLSWTDATEEKLTKQGGTWLLNQHLRLEAGNNHSSKITLSDGNYSPE